ncbi:calmodulin [Enteropsectra breve]|nr:calmodulin [Enteropsectra breve]
MQDKKVVRRTTRIPSNVFKSLTNEQMKRMRDAFDIFDTYRSGHITQEGLSTFLESIGSPFTDAEVAEMIDELGADKSYFAFINMISQCLSRQSSTQDIMEWLSLFDEDGKGYVPRGVLQEWMTEKGDKISVEDFDLLVRDCEEKEGISCKKLALKIRHGEIISDDGMADESQI